ncbi:AAA family ATPase [Dolichospermum sp. ST_con]|nr:AAA family ATPase [Dolichospermum sp. ST_con]MDD1420557.1 AAA family ATPase [Dolichospermum sp. ST_sed1]MDD1426032.1 AAA family ATPase [Dolichospermum sp. ST_sed9]MDD1436375.1 AAA family ATPase [Dolichospermum sp. ST_sed10]MDD1442041.1 AAA family ATPase [Dolichospermum sp. ST_sed3]MDD1447794.1 AAA family ATPase [Dolichospermum sp. ST_sed8]MDD1456199.1 AAA family ATPase [Dolichospermum sp. ST_sed7]MDD1461794.1 AAA family ATPase [Dolichospermum sp. ST_sed2]MDD1465929.1 AAA family ATPase [D
MVQKIALFNHKGGVSKTTTTFNLGWMLASKGKRVILVDTDPQCNLTGMALKEETEDDEARIETIYNRHSNIKTGLAPAFESQPRAIEAVDCIQIEGQEGLFLLPGHVGFGEYEVTLGIAQELSGSIHTLKNLPGAISDLLEKTANKFNADYILIDMSPSLGSINQNLLVTSDFFLVPTTADFFSVMAIDSLSRILPKWCAWARMASANPILKEATYPFPEFKLKFLGTIVQNYRIRNGKETKAFQTWIEKVENTVTNKLKPVLEKNNLLLPDQVYTEQGMNGNFTMTKIPDFNSLIGLSQEHATPVYALTPEQLNQQGIVKVNNEKKQEEFKTTFSDLANKIIALSSSYAVSP